MGQHQNNLSFLVLVLGPGLDSISPYIGKYKITNVLQEKKNYHIIKIVILKQQEVLLLEITA